MSTKTMPSKFNCYAAALPDEPVFTILGRDPAAPATVKFWIEERIRQGKFETHDDVARIGEASAEMRAFALWREQNLDPFGDGPTWKLKRQIESDEPPIRVEDAAMDCSVKDAIESVINDMLRMTSKMSGYASVHAELVNGFSKRLTHVVEAIDANAPVLPTAQDVDENTPLTEALEAISVIAKQPEVKYDEWLKICRIADALLHQAKSGTIAYYPTSAVHVGGVFRFGDVNYPYERLAEIVEEHAERMSGRLPSNLHNPQDLKDIDNHSEVRRKIGCGIRQVAEDIRAYVVTFGMGRVYREKMLECVDRLNGHAAELDGGYIPGGSYAPLGETYAPEGKGFEPFRGTVTHALGHLENLKPGEKIIVDSAPEDLAHAPEVPQHRFSQFNKGKHYAYARGLEINPSHLPTALDAMQKDGWELVSLFGQTASEHVGFVFKRVTPAAYFIPGMDEIDADDLRRVMTERPVFDQPKDKTTLHPQGRGGPKIEVHVEGVNRSDALKLMRQIECRLGWLDGPRTLRVVGLIAHDPQAAFDFTQASGAITRRSTLTEGDCGDMEFGRQQEP